MKTNENGTGPRVNGPPGQAEKGSKIEVVDGCFCENGHSLLRDLATFAGYGGITLKLDNGQQQGLLSLSPVIGDKARTFFDTEWTRGEIVEICCPECSQPLPVYNECACGANLVVMFISEKNDFANCIGICQRIGCTHSEINSNRDLQLNSRKGYFGRAYHLYGR